MLQRAACLKAVTARGSRLGSRAVTASATSRVSLLALQADRPQPFASLRFQSSAATPSFSGEPSAAGSEEDFFEDPRPRILEAALKHVKREG